MLSLKRPIIFSLLFLVIISTQNTLALTYLPESSYYSGTQYIGAQNDFVRVEFAVYNNGGAEFTEGVGGYALPSSFTNASSGSLSKFEYIYAYQVINDVSSSDVVLDYFSIHGIGEDAFDPAEGEDFAMGDHIGSVADETGEPGDTVGQKPADSWLTLGADPEEDGEAYFSSAYWEFDHAERDDEGELIDDGGQILENGKYSYFLLIGSNSDYQAGSFNFANPVSGGGPVPGGSGASSGEGAGQVAILNPEPCTLVLFGLGSILMSKRQRKK